MATRGSVLSALLCLFSFWFVNSQNCSGWISPCSDDSNNGSTCVRNGLNLTFNRSCRIMDNDSGANVTYYRVVNIAGGGEDTNITCSDFTDFAKGFTNLDTLTVENLTIESCDKSIVIENVADVTFKNINFR